MDGTGEHDLKQNYPGLEGQRLHVLPHMWIIYLKTNAAIDERQVTLRGGRSREG
jgi:hypothetical protein